VLRLAVQDHTVSLPSLRRRAEILRQQSRFLRRQSERLQARSSDLQTICLFSRESFHRRTQSARAPLVLIS